MFNKRKSLLLGILAAATATGLALGVNGVVDAYVGEPVEVSAAGVPDNLSLVTDLKQTQPGDKFILGAFYNNNFYGFSDGTEKWGKASISDSDWKEFEILDNGDNTFKATVSLDSSNYYLTIPTSNTWQLATSSTAANTTLKFGTSLSIDDSAQAITNVGTTSRHIRLNGTSGFRSYANTTGTIAGFYKISVDLPELDSLEISGEFKTEYAEGETLDLAGMVVTANFSEGEPVVLSNSDYSVNLDGAPLKTTDTEFVVSYTYNQKEVTVSYPITVAPRTLQSIAVTKNPTKTSYVVGQTLDTTGIVVAGSYDSGDPADLTAECTFSPTTLDAVGEQIITVTHTPSGKTASFNVTVVERKV